MKLKKPLPLPADQMMGGATSKRILGTFLNWMQERRGDVFIIATANGIEDLPP